MTLVLVLLALSLLIYWPSLRGPQIWDDFNISPATQQGRFEAQWYNLRWLTTLSWALPFRWKLGGEGQHLLSALIHWLAACATIPVARALDLNDALVALIFVSHPLAVSSVASVGQRASVLSQMLVIAGLAAAVSIHWAVSLLLWALALAAKEDALGLLSLIGLVDRHWRSEFWRALSARGLEAAGQSSGLPLRDHLPTAIVGNLRRLPGWLLGIGLETYYRRPAVPAIWKVIVNTLLLLGVTAAMLSAGSPWTWIVLLFWLSPFVLYWFLPLPHVVVDSRAYGLTLPVALALAALLPLWAAPIASVGLAIRSAWLARRWSDPVLYWRSTSADDETARINLATSLQGAGQLPEAMRLHQRTLSLNPDCALAYCNLALIAEAHAREFLSRSVPAMLHRRLDENHQQFVFCLRSASELMDKALSLAPTDPSIQRFHAHVARLRSDLGVS